MTLLETVSLLKQELLVMEPFKRAELATMSSLKPKDVDKNNSCSVQTGAGDGVCAGPEAVFAAKGGDPLAGRGGPECIPGAAAGCGLPPCR